GTSHGTSAGHLRDMSREEEIIENPHPKQETKPKTAINNPESITDNIPESFDRSRFPASELEIIKTLYYYERPLSYGDIAKSLGKKEKSIRNLICELRKKGIEILDKPIGIREKGFYLSGKAKITISGR
ncbi:MAG: hypothetical protein NTV63_05665, partial [Candidatus Woesearchaeota archaeon]|nr:hypothetical protein [Candidatus Woesearchaeota archaeon]